MYYKYVWLVVLSIVIHSHTALSASFYLDSTCQSATQRQQLASFADHVLRQHSSHTIMQIIDEILTAHIQPLDDATWYTLLQKHLTPYQSRLDVLRIKQLIRFQQALLKEQIITLLEPKYKIRNCVEIGTPATYMSTLRDSICGTIYAITPNESITDIVQASSYNLFKKFRAYDQHIALANYDPISPKISDNSIDLVICTIGLHHVPPEKLRDFIASIYRILKPGGIFILREHDAHNHELHALAYAAHSLFNAIIPQEELATEINEVRNFNPLSYWKQLLSSHGFSTGQTEIVQEGDSTLNTLMKFIKQPSTTSDQIAIAREHVRKNTDYHRDQAQTFLTAPEWNNVDIATAYSAFIKHTPFYEFPYIQHIQLYWKLFVQSGKHAAIQKGGYLKLLTAGSSVYNYVLMNLFIGISMTIEFLFKSLVSLPVRMVFSGAESETLYALLYDPKNELGNYSAITLQQEYPDGIKLVKLPRYMQFLSTIQAFARNNSIQMIEIAGNQYIACKVKYIAPAQRALNVIAQEAFTWNMPTDLTYTYATYYVPIKDLITFIAVAQKHDVIVLYIHDF